jgi:hypothetical protein
MMKYIDLIFGFLLIGSPVQAAGFTDVDENTEYVEAIEYLAERGIVSGFGDGRFGPEETLTRAELLKILLEADEDFDVNSFDGELDCFADVMGYEWYAPHVCYAKSVGIVEGFGDGLMRPNKEVSFVAAAKMVVETLNLPKPAKTNVWYEHYTKALTQGRNVPRSVKRFEQKVIRNQIAEIIWRILKNAELQDEESYSTAIRRDWMSYNGIELQTEQSVQYTKAAQAIKNNLGLNHDDARYYPLDLWETDISELEHLFFTEKNVNALARSIEYDDITLIFIAQQNNGVYGLRFLIINDKKNQKLYLTNKPVWDAKLADGILYLGSQEHLGELETIDKGVIELSSALQVNPGKICKHLWFPVTERSVVSVARLWKVDAGDFTVSDMGLFGGQEIANDESGIRFSSYSRNFAEPAWNQAEKSCNKNYLEHSAINSCWLNASLACNELNIPILDVSEIAGRAEVTYRNTRIGELYDILSEFQSHQNPVAAVDVIAAIGKTISFDNKTNEQ